MNTKNMDPVLILCSPRKCLPALCHLLLQVLEHAFEDIKKAAAGVIASANFPEDLPDPDVAESIKKRLILSDLSAITTRSQLGTI
jgi:hypothetical protein